MDRKFAMTAFGYAILGLILGIIMAATKNHSQLVTHAHIMLLGFVVSFIYAVSYKLWLTSPSPRTASIQYYTHQIGTVITVVGLFCLYGGYGEEAVLGPILGIGSITALASMIIMKVMFIQSKKAQ